MQNTRFYNFLTIQSEVFRFFLINRIKKIFSIVILFVYLFFYSVIYVHSPCAVKSADAKINPSPYNSRVCKVMGAAPLRSCPFGPEVNHNRTGGFGPNFL